MGSHALSETVPVLRWARTLVIVGASVAVVGCSSGTPATESPSANLPPTPPATVEPTATPKLSQSPASVSDLAEHIVRAIDRLDGMATTGFTDAEEQWAIDEGQWVAENAEALLAAPAPFRDYAQQLLGLNHDRALDDADAYPGFAWWFVIGFRDRIAEFAPQAVATEVPTGGLRSESGFTFHPGSPDGDYVDYAVVLTNPNADRVPSDLTVVITFLLSDGSIAGEACETVEVALPGPIVFGGIESAWAGEVTAMDVTVRNDWVPLDASPGEYSITQVTTTSEGSVTTTRGLISGSALQFEGWVYVVAVYRGASGGILAGASADFEGLPSSGEAVPFEMSTWGVIDGVAKTEVWARHPGDWAPSPTPAGGGGSRGAAPR